MNEYEQVFEDIVDTARKIRNWSTAIIAVNIILFLYLMWRIYLVS